LPLFPSIGIVEKIVHVTEVQSAGEHRLRLSFDDGRSGEVDFSDEEWAGVFAPLADPVFFAKVELDEELGTIVWPNGADIAPETLYRLATA
jgi:Protein of unknown function (DUF2442)